MTVDTDKLPTDALAQEGPIGGVNDGRTPSFAVPTVGVGIATTRELPTLRHTAFSIQLLQTAAPYRIGAEPRRRRLTLSASPNATAVSWLIVATSQEQARDRQGFILAQGQLITVGGADELWVAAVNADLYLSLLAELDQG